MAVAADGQVLEDDGRRVLGVDRTVAPADARGVLHGRDERQRNLAIEDRVAHRVRRGADADAGRRGGRSVRAEADDGHVRVPLHAALLDPGPIRFCWTPAGLCSGKPQDLARVVIEPQQDHPLLDALGLVVPDESRGDDLRWEQRFVERVLDLEPTGRPARELDRGRRGTFAAGSQSQQRYEQETDVAQIFSHSRPIVGVPLRLRQTRRPDSMRQANGRGIPVPIYHKAEN